MDYLSALISTVIEFLQNCLTLLEQEIVSYLSPAFHGEDEYYIQLTLFDVNRYSFPVI